MFLSLLCATYVFTCHSQSSLAEFPECWVKPAAELSMSTSDAFTVPCSQPSEYFPKTSLAWLLHSASSQVFAIACVLSVGSLTRSLSLSYLLAPSYSWIILSISRFPSWIFPSYLLLHTVPPSGSLFILVFSPTTYSSLVLSSFFFFTFLHLHFFQPLSHVLTPPVWWSSPPALFPLISSCILFFNRMSTLTFLSPFLWVDGSDVELLLILSQDRYCWNKFRWICFFEYGQGPLFVCSAITPLYSDVCFVWMSMVVLDARIYLSGSKHTFNRALCTHTRDTGALSRIRCIIRPRVLCPKTFCIEKRIDILTFYGLVLFNSGNGHYWEMSTLCHLLAYSQTKGLLILSRLMQTLLHA